jgi:ubiquinone/menaquinone biosynthesis C-methylase UbiE
MKPCIFASLVLGAVLLTLPFEFAQIGKSNGAPSEVLWAQGERAKTPKKAPAKPDGTTRQTAQPWTGSPLGPGEAFEAPNRAEVLRIQTVMDDLGIVRGSAVADIGAGGGWFSMIAARRVGPEGVVYAEEILPKYTRFIARRAKREGLNNVRPILGTVTAPKLPANSVDAVLILNAYHEFEQPLGILRKIHVAMRPGARLGFIERDNAELRQQARDAYAQTGKIKRRVDEQPDNDPHTDDHRLAREIVEREAMTAGFKLIKSYNLGADHYITIVVKQAAASGD